MNIGLTTSQGKGTINKIGKLTISLDEIVLMINLRHFNMENGLAEIF